MATPLNKKVDYFNSVVTSDITWTGEDIPCLGITNGCNVNLVVYKIAKKGM